MICDNFITILKTENKKKLYFPSFFIKKMLERIYTQKQVCYNKYRL